MTKKHVFDFITIYKCLLQISQNVISHFYVSDKVIY